MKAVDPALGEKRVGIHIFVLPNLLTTVNMFFGFFAIIYSINGNFTWAAYAIVIGALFDQLDGRVARMTNSVSKFGAEYDSLSDLVSFGLAPGLLLFLWSLEPFGRLGWLASFFYVACGALRLARFNVQSTSVEKAFFQGLPIPMAAGIVASSVLAFEDLELDAARSWGLLAMTILLGFVMVSTFRYRSFKDLDFKRRLPFKYLVVGVFIFAAVAIRPETMLFVLFMTYAILGAVFGIWRIGRPVKPTVSYTIQAQVDTSDEEIVIDDTNP
jgi:CDP-diacylglycerol--serine O-phosphatidyltransferase